MLPSIESDPIERHPWRNGAKRWPPSRARVLPIEGYLEGYGTDLFFTYELHDQFTLHDVSYLLDGHEPLSPDLPPKNDPHERIRHRANMLGRQLINDGYAYRLDQTARLQH